MMTWLFDEVFEAVQGAMELDWWELYDSDAFGTVVEMIAQIMGITVEELEDCEDFCDWDSEMAGEL